MAQESGRPRVVVVGLDGTPYTFARRMLAEGRMPNLARIVARGSLAQMSSTHPCVSSVAWSSFATGRNPAGHGIFGFVDRQPGSYRLYIPTARNLRAETLWELLSRAGRRVAVMNVPVTYPPRPVNGILVGCFLSPSLEKATYPASLAGELKAMGYRIDTDPWQARQSRDLFLDDFRLTLAKRAAAALYYLDSEPWDLFVLHIMETDRLHHFLWQQWDEGDPQYAPAFLDCYRQIDEVLGEFWERVEEDPATTLVVLSDHGFCTLRQEVYVNRWLVDQGWLRFRSEAPKSLEEIDPASRAYAVDPGRVSLNLRGREPAGSVEPADYERVRDELAAGLAELRDPATGERMVRRVHRREEVYHGRLLAQAADLILEPVDGYDLKGAVNRPTLTHKDVLVGMHTLDDALLYVQGREIVPPAGRPPGIADVFPTILRLLGVPAPADLDGVALV